MGTLKLSVTNETLRQKTSRRLRREHLVLGRGHHPRHRAPNPLKFGAQDASGTQNKPSWCQDNRAISIRWQIPSVGGRKIIYDAMINQRTQCAQRQTTSISPPSRLSEQHLGEGTSGSSMPSLQTTPVLIPPMRPTPPKCDQRRQNAQCRESAQDLTGPAGINTLLSCMQ